MASFKAREKKIASVMATQKMLRSIIQNPSQFAEESLIREALKSQGALAKLDYVARIDDESFQKTPMSLNTLKHYADELLEGGFEGLNHLRRGAIDALEAFTSRPKGDASSKAGLLSKIQDLNERIEILRGVNYRLLQTISSEISTIKSVRDAPDSESRAFRAQKGMDRIRAILSLNPRPYNSLKESSVINISDYQNED